MEGGLRYIDPHWLISMLKRAISKRSNNISDVDDDDQYTHFEEMIDIAKRHISSLDNWGIMLHDLCHLPNFEQNVQVIIRNCHEDLNLGRMFMILLFTIEVIVCKMKQSENSFNASQVDVLLQSCFIQK